MPAPANSKPGKPPPTTGPGTLYGVSRSAPEVSVILLPNSDPWIKPGAIAISAREVHNRSRQHRRIAAAGKCNLAAHVEQHFVVRQATSQLDLAAVQLKVASHVNNERRV